MQRGDDKERECNGHIQCQETTSSIGGYTLTITKTGTGSGTVTTNPAGPTYPSGTAVTLTATPGSNSVFAGWSGACSGTATTCQGDDDKERECNGQL